MRSGKWQPWVPAASTGRPATAGSALARPRLTGPLCDTESGSVVVLSAPAGYGKTTAVAQWDRCDERPFAWLRIDHLNHDPAHLVLHIATAVDRVHPLDRAILRYLRGPGRDPLTQLAPALSNALRDCPPLVLVFDDIDALADTDAAAVLRALLADAPMSLTLVFVGRCRPPVDLARIRAQRRLVELGIDDLRFSDDEAATVFAAVSRSADRAAALNVHELCEGWPAGVVLAALAVRDGASAASITGRNRFLADYLVEEVLANLDPATAEFLMESSTLDRFCAADLDALLQREDSARMLSAIMASGNLFLFSTDADRLWFRYHALLRQVLRARLRALQPQRHRALASRAADLLERHGDVDGALLAALDAEDRGRAAALVGREAVRLGFDGRAGVLARRIALLDERTFDHHPDAAIARAWLGVTTGDADLIQRSLTLAVRADRGDPLADGSPSVSVAVALVNSLVGQGGLPDVVRNADIVRQAGDQLTNPWWAAATVMHGAALSMMGDSAGARDLLTAALPTLGDLPGFHAAALAHLALLDLRDGRDDDATAGSAAARRIADDSDLCDVVPMVVVYAVSAVVTARSGDSSAPAALETTERLLDRLGDLAPRTALLGHTLCAWAATLLGDAGALRRHLDAAGRAGSREPDAHALRRLLERVRSSATDNRLTPAESRLLPQLATHRSLQAIADELSVGRETVKSQAASIYRKLGASSRSDAIATATRIGLLPGPG